MPSGGFRPFLELSNAQDAITANNWTLDGDPVGDGAVIPGWGYAMQLEFRRTFRLDPARIRDECQLDRQCVLRLICSWSAQSALNLGKTVTSFGFALLGDEEFHHDLVAEVPSPSVAENLILQSVLMLDRHGPEAVSPLAAKQPGSILWEDSVSLIVEGRSARMPILAIDFSKFKSVEQDAAWFVLTGSNWLQQDPTAGITVYINAGRPLLLGALSARRPDPHQLSIQSVFYHDVGRILLERALDDEDFNEDVDFRTGSTGGSIQSTLRSMFGQESFAQIRKSKADDPAGFERTLQTRNKLLSNLG
jgi:hypothetical protein